MPLVRSSTSSKGNYFNTKEIKPLTRLRLGLYHIRDGNFKHGFHDSLNPNCSCGLDIEKTCLCLLHWKNTPPEWCIKNNQRFLSSCETTFAKILVYGDDSFGSATNAFILNASVEYILSSKRFDGALLQIFLFMLYFIRL